MSRCQIGKAIVPGARRSRPQRTRWCGTAARPAHKLLHPAQVSQEVHPRWPPSAWEMNLRTAGAENHVVRSHVKCSRSLRSLRLLFVLKICRSEDELHNNLEKWPTQLTVLHPLLLPCAQSIPGRGRRISLCFVQPIMEHVAIGATSLSAARMTGIWTGHGARYVLCIVITLTS